MPNTIENTTLLSLAVDSFLSKNGSIALALEEMLDSHIAKTKVITLPASICLGGWLQSDSSTAKKLHWNFTKPHSEGLEFQFEELLPLDLEEVECRFLQVPQGAYGIAVRREQLASLHSQIESLGVQRCWIAPKVLLYVQALVDSIEDSESNLIVVAQDREGVHLCAIRDSSIRRWLVFPPTSKEITPYIEELCHASPGQNIYFFQDGKEGLVPLDLSATPNVQDVSDLIPLKLIGFLDALESGRFVPWFDFSINSSWVSQFPALGRWRNVAGMTTLLAVFLFGIGFWIRSHLDRTLVQKELVAQQELYQKLFPNSRVPRSIRRVLESEVSKIDLTSLEELDRPKTPTAIYVWLQTIKQLPPDGSFRVESMEFSNQAISLIDGQAATFEQLQELIDRLRQGGFTIELPSVNRQGSGVAMQIRNGVLNLNNWTSDSLNGVSP